VGRIRQKADKLAAKADFFMENKEQSDYIFFNPVK